MQTVANLFPNCTDLNHEKSIHDFVAMQAHQAPERIAVVCESKSISYGELNIAANRLAHRLIQLGVGRGTLVALAVDRSLEMIIGQLGILKAGGTYVQLELQYPLPRLEAILAEGAIRFLIDGANLAHQLVFPGKVLSLTDGFRPGAPENDPIVESAPTDIAFVVFTSGSTGVPKGVPVSHRAILRLTNGSWLPFSSDDVIAQTTNACFDVSTLEIWAALTNGACLVIILTDTLLAPDVLADAINQQGITFMALTTALFHEIAAADASIFCNIRQLVLAGDVLDPKWTQEVLSRSAPEHLINAYGPAENGVLSTSYDCRNLPPHASSVPIGWPVPGTSVHIFDSELNPVAPGIAGDIYLGGDGLSPGYLNRSDLSAERFVPHPLVASPAVLYDTGDRGRILTNGALEFLGRRDNQVKIRGFRVEPSEVEIALNSHPLVRQAAVITPEGSSQRFLVAYVTAVAAATLDVADLRAHVRQILPDYLIPRKIRVLDQLPLSPNGKVDRRSLLDMATGKEVSLHGQPICNVG